MKSNGQHYQNNSQFHEHGNGNNGYYSNDQDAFPQRCQRATASNESGTTGQANAHGIALYGNSSYYNLGCNNQQCGQHQCGQQHNGYYNGYHNNNNNNSNNNNQKFSHGYSRSNNTNLQQQQDHQNQQQHQQLYLDLDRKQENEAVTPTGLIEENASFQSPQVPQVFDASNNMVLKDMSTSLSSLYDENTFFQMSTVFSES
jgi:hypothetical protein